MANKVSKIVDKKEELTKKMQKFFSEVMRAVGFVFLFGFTMIGSYFYYFRQTGDPITTIFISSVVVIMLYAMTQVKDRW